MQNGKDIILFSTTETRPISEGIFKSLKKLIGRKVKLGESEVETYPNNNLRVQTEEVRDKSVIIVHTQTDSVHDEMVELIGLLDAVKNARPAQVILVMPYMPYARAERHNAPHISAIGRWYARTLSDFLLGEADSVLLVDPHSKMMREYFDPIAEEVTLVPLLANHFKKSHNLKSWVVVYPDEGAADRFGKLSEFLKLSSICTAKTRSEKYGIDSLFVTGDVKGKNCLIIDDEILSGGTAFWTADSLIAMGAKSVEMIAVHPILKSSGLDDKKLMERFEKSSIKKFYVADTVCAEHKTKLCKKFDLVSGSPLISTAIFRLLYGGSLTKLREFK